MTNGNGQAELVTISINGQEAQAEKGRLLIDVAEELGIFVPRFCYHPGMKSVAVCRMCLVKVEGAPKLLPSCATPVDDGMKVETSNAEAVDAQEGMLEFLLINHPLDCPICDRGGECPLQDQTYRHGPGSTRYVEEKRHFEKALEISDLVVLDRERCVLCWRCVRFADEIAGDRFIQLVDRGPGTQILTFSDEPFDSYFSGNTVQICPVGALTAKPYRFVSRPWDLETAPSVCAYCSVGCPITNESREGRLVRCQALPNERVNDFWNCDKGRFGYHYVGSKERLTSPLIRKDDSFEITSWGQVLQTVGEKLKSADRIGVIAGAHLTTEDAYAIGKLSKKVLETKDVDFRLQDEGTPYEALIEVAGVAGSDAELDDLDEAGSIVWIGPDPKETLPVLYLRIRGAVVNRGVNLVVVGSRRISLDDLATRVVRTTADGEANALTSLVGGSDEFAQKYLKDPLVVAWGPSSPGRDESRLVEAVTAFARAHNAKVLACPPHAGSQGMIDMGVHPSLDAGYQLDPSPGKGTRQILEAAAARELDALILFGADPISDFPDAGLARRALEAGVFTVVVELFPTDPVAYADVVLPSAAYAEREGTFTNLERRIQKLEQLLAPLGTARQPWQIAASIARAVGDDWGWRSCNDVWDDIRANVPTHANVQLDAIQQEMPTRSLQYETGFQTKTHEALLSIAGPGAQYPKGYRSGAPFQTGQNWPLSWELRAFEARQRPGFVPALPEHGAVPEEASVAGHSIPRPARTSDGGTAPRAGTFALYSGRFIYDEGAMVSRTAHLRNLQKKPFIEMHELDVKELGLSDGDVVTVSADGFETQLNIVVADIARGAVFVPYDQRGLKANELMNGLNPSVEVRPA